MKIQLPYKFTPRFYQQRYFDYYDHGGRNGFWVWHRRAGKDLTALHQINKQAHKRKGMYWHCLPTYSQGRKAIWNNFNNSTGERLLRSVFPKEIVKHPDDFRPQAEMLIELKCGSLIQIVGSDSIDNIVGTGPLHVTFSEYALCKPNSYDLVRPMLRQNGGSVSFITTPRGRNHAWKQFQINKKTGGFVADVQTVLDTDLRYPSDRGQADLLTPEEMMEEEKLAGMQPELIRQEYLCDFEAALIGSVYGDLLEEMENQGRITNFAHDGSQVFVSLDLGMNDMTSIWFWEVHDGGVDILDHYSNHGKPLSHYFDVIHERRAKHSFTFKRIWLPHDARQEHLGTVNTIEAQFSSEFGSNLIEICPKLAILDGIQAARWLLQQNTRIHQRCNELNGIDALKQYHYEFDEKRKVYTNRPEHDWSSHDADGIRYLAIVAKVSGILAKPRPPDKKRIYVPGPAHMTQTLDDLFAQREAGLNKHRRIA